MLVYLTLSAQIFCRCCWPRKKVHALGELWQNIFSSPQRKMEVVVGATLGGAPPILCVASRGKAGSGHGWATWVVISLSRWWIEPTRSAAAPQGDRSDEIGGGEGISGGKGIGGGERR